MKKSRKILIGLFTIVLVLFLGGFLTLKLLVSPDKVVKAEPLKELTNEEKIQDFRYLYDTLKDSFPFFEIEKEKTGFDWLANKEKFEEQIKTTKNNKEFYNSLKKIVNTVQNAHTGLLSPMYYENMSSGYSGIENYAWKQILTQTGVKEKYSDWSKIISESRTVLPIKLKYIEGKYVVNEDYDDVKKGDILESIEDKNIDSYLKDNLDKYYVNYDDKRNKIYMNSSMFSVDEGKVYKVTFITRDNLKLTKNLTPVKYEQNSKGQQSSSSCEEKILKENKIAYLKVKAMSSDTLQSDKKKILDFYEKIKDYPYLIIDIRGNGGGNDEYWRSNITAPLIQEGKSSSIAMAYKGKYIKPFLRGRGITTDSIEKLPEKFGSKYTASMERFLTTSTKVTPQNSVGFKGKIYLLVDDYVYSSSESFAAFCKGSGFAQIVGTTTGGDGIGIDPCVMALPNSGLVVRFSLDMGINSDGTVNEKTHTKSDIFSELTYGDFIKGEDTVLNKAVELCK